jgi:hypothetical protein
MTNIALKRYNVKMFSRMFLRNKFHHWKNFSLFSALLTDLWKYFKKFYAATHYFKTSYGFIKL